MTGRVLNQGHKKRRQILSKVHAKLFLYLKGSPRILESCSSNESGRQGRRLLSTMVSKVLFFLLVAEYSFSVFVLLFSSEWNDFSVIMLGGGVEISWRCASKLVSAWILRGLRKIWWVWVLGFKESGDPFRRSLWVLRLIGFLENGTPLRRGGFEGGWLFSKWVLNLWALGLVGSGTPWRRSGAPSRKRRTWSAGWT